MIRILVPCFNEASVIEKTYAELTEIMQQDSRNNNYKYELLFVDDGSKDNTLSIIRQLAQQDYAVKYISFSRNFGKESAMYAGLKASVEAEALIILDGDLQHPPTLIPQMIKYFREGEDQIVAKRDRAGENLIRKRVSQLYYTIINKMVDVTLEDGVGDFRLLSQRAVKEIVNMGEYNRFSKGLFAWIGFEPKIIEYQNVNRVDGESKWSFSSLLNYGIDGLISFNNKPLRAIIYLGLFICGMSFLYILFNFIYTINYGVSTPGYFTTIFSVLFLGGVQLTSLGVIGEYIGRIYYEVKQRPLYIVRQTNLNEQEVE
ncbi:MULTISPECIES: glycosyltransferase family 2 protein [Staphylococcus]|uniref:glycosyltransferase family 2 protein n=1 Tax=Staphylococcus TaxID=1279 RepID=UPI002E173BB3|nr:glycosyltransferase family 2 protein [Staphylococcus shinii]